MSADCQWDTPPRGGLSAVVIVIVTAQNFRGRYWELFTLLLAFVIFTIDFVIISKPLMLLGLPGGCPILRLTPRISRNIGQGLS